jgi:hypothetical protein
MAVPRFETIPSVIFRGLVCILPLVQHFPEDRHIYLETDNGVCSIVTWVHHILGLSVLVRLHSNGKFVEYRFGSSEVVIIDVRSDELSLSPSSGQILTTGSSITLLSSSDKETLFKMVADPDENKINATFKRPAYRYGSDIIDRSLPLQDGREKVAAEMEAIVTAFAICISRALYTPGLVFPYEVSEFRIYESASLPFANRKMKKKKVGEYVAKYSERALYKLPAPGGIYAIIEDWPEALEEDTEVWPDLRLRARLLSILFLAFAHVSDLPAASDLPLCQFLHLLSGCDLDNQVAQWDGSSQLQIKSNAWLEILAQLMIGHKDEVSHETTSLVCATGWSVFLNTFGDADPSFIVI